MKAFKIFIALFFIVFFSNSFGQALSSQCKQMAINSETEYISGADYLSDGHYYGMMLSAGQYFQIYKPFFKQRKYKIVVIAKETLPGVQLTIKDYRNSVLVDKKSEDGSNVIEFEFSVERTQNLKITVKVLSNGNATDQVKDCVVLLIGFTNK